MRFGDYCRERGGFFVLLLIFSIINLIILFLYQQTLEPCLYIFLLCLLAAVTVGYFDYKKCNKKHKVLSDYDFTVHQNLETQIPQPTLWDRYYWQIIEGLEKKLHELQISTQKTIMENGDFYMMWVHQIKTPISALRLLIQTSPEDVTAIKNELFLIEQYVDVMLCYSRLEDLNHDLVLRHYSLDDMIKQAVRKYTPLFIHSKVRLVLKDISCQVLTDEKWLVFVLEQILSNALKYTPKGSISISAETKFYGDGRETLLSIEDTGIGIAPENLPLIFQRGYTGFNGRMDKKASGLGLYLSKRILNKLGHEIQITSEPGAGTCVIISFQEISMY
ncbi:MAG: sensor histidine kinase [Lachnospiraceae bacterium]|nr:sensor histidine kinase [Lachnospiraceae bacterium]